MATFPPLAADRLSGLSDVPRTTIKSIEKGTLPPNIDASELNEQLKDILKIIRRLLDRDLMPWIKEGRDADQEEYDIAVAVIADRLCGSMADPDIRNAQERRQLDILSDFLESLGYEFVESHDLERAEDMEPGTYSFHVNVPVAEPNKKTVGMPIDVAIKSFKSKTGELPILIECKSAGDFTNTNKRRKKEAQKVNQLRKTYGESSVTFILFLCGYFDASYLGYEAAEGIDRVWEHRVEDLKKAGL